MYNIYPEIRKRMRCGDLLEFQGDYMISKAIRFFTKKDVNHTAMVFKSPYADKHRFIFEALSFGLELNLISKRLEGYKGRVFWHQLKVCHWSENDTIGELCLLAEGRVREMRYDYLSIFRQMYRTVPVDVSKRIFCSEFCHWIYEEAGLIRSGMRAKRPGEFEDLDIHKPRQLIYASDIRS